ncbi:hypothetical protein [Streptomyces sp. NBC_01012]|uniref:hypothetical protein n=1 Tax=Streptomyces sp. NBC_01012 TaxID=2903717 RepID=UPI00386BE8E4|nr:hypothetical protein OG623_25410 [Streptomyces sp. NBC_01012]
MTACAIEDKTTGVAGAATTAGPAPGSTGSEEPTEPVEPHATDEPEDAEADATGAQAHDAAARDAVPYDTEAHSGPDGTDSTAETDPAAEADRTAEADRADSTARIDRAIRAIRTGRAARAASSVPPLPFIPPVPSVPPLPPPLPPALTLAAGHAYAARLTVAGEMDGETAGETAGPGWFPERWTLDGPEPYAVPLPLDQPEDAGSDVLPLSDGRVLIRREVAAGSHTFSLLYPTGPGTGEVSLGSLDCTELTLLPPSPDGVSAYALLPGERSTGVWLVAGGAFGPEQVADVPGHCSGGVWLDHEGRMLALDRQMPGGGPVKAVVADLERGGEVTPLLQIAPDSNDRLLTADADSGLLLVRSDAPGHDRLGWGVLGSCLPVRFPECLRPSEGTLTPFAVQPGQMLMPESCAVALRIDGAAGSWVGLWRPAGRRLHQFAAPDGWLAGSGFWTREGVLHLPYSQEGAPCAVALVEAPVDEPHPAPGEGTDMSGATPPRGVCTPVPLGQAPLTGRTAPG